MGAAEHKLRPLLNPQSIAFLGASTRPDSVGHSMVRMPLLCGFKGRLYPINPNYDSVEGLRCFPSLAALPETVDHVVIGVSNARVEQALDDVIAHGARAATIFSSCVLERDSSPPLAVRLARRAREADIAVCGGNCMGFYNLDADLRVAGFPSALDMTPGSITFIAQSGSAFGALAHNDRRLKFNLVVSSGAELVTGAADYLDWALAQDSTRVIALFLETVRAPEKFCAALAKAASRDIPVVVLKIGRTAASAAMAVSHTGALTGSDAAYEAVFSRYGVTRVDTLDELAATLLLFSHPRRPAKGGLAAMHDSGGEREMVADLAERAAVSYARISPATIGRLTARLDHGLDAMNPLDVWGTGEDYVGVMADCMTALAEDPDTAIGVFFNDLRDNYHISDGFTTAILQASARTTKPLAIATNYALVRHEKIALAVTEAGVPVLDGTQEALLAVRHLLRHRDFRWRAAPASQSPVGDDVRSDWAARMSDGTAFDEARSLDLLASYGIAGPARRRVTSRQDALAAASTIGWPVAAKTAMPGIAHKSEVGGVHLGLRDEAALVAAYDDLAGRLGPEVLLEHMAPDGVEIALGAVNDPQFGPYIMVAAGGTLIELLQDRAIALAPVDHAEAEAMLARLRIGKLLAGLRGRKPADIAALVECIVRFSWLAWDFRERFAEIDVNPLIAGPGGCIAVDALFVPAHAG
jgi:acetate---CoA ligase (ADP-forming)